MMLDSLVVGDVGSAGRVLASWDVVSGMSLKDVRCAKN